MTILPTLIIGLYYLITIFTYVLFIYALMSWFPAISQSPLGDFVRRLVEPYLSIFDRIPTRFGMFDFKVFIGIMALLAIQRFILFFL